MNTKLETLITGLEELRTIGYRISPAQLDETIAALRTTNVQSLRKKHYEECAVIANSCEFGVTKNFVAEQIRKAKENI